MSKQLVQRICWRYLNNLRFQNECSKCQSNDLTTEMRRVKSTDEISFTFNSCNRCYFHSKRF